MWAPALLAWTQHERDGHQPHRPAQTPCHARPGKRECLERLKTALADQMLESLFAGGLPGRPQALPHAEEGRPLREIQPWVLQSPALLEIDADRHLLT